MGIIERKKRILLNEPHLETVTGNGVSFVADRVASIQTCRLDLTAYQTGTGTPSPTNIRPVIGYKDFSVYHSGADQSNPDEYSFNWAAGRSLGAFNLITGVVYTQGYVVEYDGNKGWQAVGNKFYCPLQDTNFQQTTGSPNQICNMYPFAEITANGSAAVTQDKHFYLQRSSTLAYCRVWVYDTGYTLDQFKALLNQTPLVFTFPIKPTIAQITSTQIKAKRGKNHIWNSNNGSMEVEYWT